MVDKLGFICLHIEAIYRRERIPHYLTLNPPVVSSVVSVCAVRYVAVKAGIAVITGPTETGS